MAKFQMNKFVRKKTVGQRTQVLRQYISNVDTYNEWAITEFRRIIEFHDGIEFDAYGRIAAYYSSNSHTAVVIREYNQEEDAQPATIRLLNREGLYDDFERQADGTYLNRADGKNAAAIVARRVASGGLMVRLFERNGELMAAAIYWDAALKSVDDLAPLRVVNRRTAV
jgi:hypothetical protein